MLIGLSGYARVGKDTAGRILVEQFGFKRVGFADKLRECALALDPYVKLDNGKLRSLAALAKRDSWEGAKDHADVRRILQRLGTEVGRDILGEDIWVTAALRNFDPSHDTVVTDTRFPNEARAIAAYGGRVWRVSRPGFGPVNDHPGEVALDNWPFDSFIHNDGTLSDLAEVVGLHIERAQKEAA